MEVEGKKGGWGLVQSAEYKADYERLSSKFRSQLSRKAHDLMSDPRPGGSRTALVGYAGLYRVRAGDFRIIYAYSEDVVQLLTLRRRNESTYDDLDIFEVQQLEAFKPIKGQHGGTANIPDWTTFAEKWLKPTAKAHEKLPEQITLKLLGGLNVPEQYWQPLLEAETTDDLLDCEGVPAEYTEAVLERLCPKKPLPQTAPPVVVVSMSDLVDGAATDSTGPIGFAAPPEEPKQGGKAIVKRTAPAPLILVSTKRLGKIRLYEGNSAKAIGKESKYTAKLNGGVQLTYGAGDNERALLTTDEHPELVEMVNAAKKFGGAAQEGGGFVINEYRHVIVPTPKGAMLAGHYTRDLEFTFNGKVISPVAPKGIKPGAIWPGPHVGIRYTLAAGAKDIRYERDTARGTKHRVSLTDLFDAEELEALLQICKAVKPSGGAIYINEARELFAPVEDGAVWRRRYIGHLGKRPWFPEPV